VLKMKPFPALSPVRFLKDFFNTFQLKEHTLSLVLIGSTLLFIVLCWVAIYLVDVVNIGGLSSVRGLWWHLFRNRGPVEWVQWIFLAYISLSAAAFFGMYRERGGCRREEIFWILAAIAFILMLIEDAGDPRHLLAEHAGVLLGMNRTLAEGIVFFLIVLPLLYAVLVHWREAFAVAQVRLYFVAGGTLYALAAVASLFREERGFYPLIGDRLSQTFTGGSIPGFFLMDFVIEESIELMAASFIAAGIIIYWKRCAKAETC